MLLIYILIFFFVSLILYQLYLVLFSNNLIEGLENQDSGSTTQENEYKPYNLNDPNNSLILAQQNAGNIEVLKGRIDNLDGVKKRVDDMQQSIDSMQTQIGNAADVDALAALVYDWPELGS